VLVATYDASIAAEALQGYETVHVPEDYLQFRRLNFTLVSTVPAVDESEELQRYFYGCARDVR
jgi:hypothetical protein